jgi:signal transduction histidine kinase
MIILMIRSIIVISVLLLSLGAFAQPDPKSGVPNTVLFITSTSSEERAFLMEQAFVSAWATRDPGVAVFNYRFASSSFPPTKRAYALAGEDLAERLSSGALRLIVAQGANSIDLAVPLREKYFPGTPIISFEVSDQTRYWYAKTSRLYQLNTHDYTKENLRLGVRLFPRATQVNILVRTGPDIETYTAILTELQKEYPGLRLAAVMNPTRDSVDVALRSSPKESFVLLLAPGWPNAEGRQLFGMELAASIQDAYGFPVIDYVREFLGGGPVGGFGVTARDYGKAVAELGLGLVLDGVEPGAWISSESLASTFVDHAALLRFGSSSSLIPAGAEIINPPVSIWDRFRNLIQIGITLLLLGMSALVVHLLERRRERKALIKVNEALEQKVADRTVELQVSNEELSAANENLTLMIRRTEAMQDSVLRNAREVTLGRLAAGIAHELNSPLNAIRSANDAVRFVLDPSRESGSPAPSAEDRLAVLGESSGIVAAAVDQVIDAIRAIREYSTESQAARESGEVLLRSSMERALLLFKNRLPNSVILKTEFSDLPKARGDESTFVRLWAHLIQNALQAMIRGGVLLVSIRREGGFAAVSIDDEGEGVSPLVSGSLFEPFVTTRPPAEGMGLGLAYCKRVVEAAGGTISWASKEKGTVFTVRIPLVEEA